MRAHLVIAAILLAAPLALATPNGPVYPPEGGVTVTPSGSMGRAGGLTWSYADLQMDLFNGIWWGPWSSDSFQFAYDGAIDEPGETLVFDFASDLAGGEARWLGSTDIRHFVGGGYTTETVQTRLTIRASLLDATAIAFLDPTTVGLDGDLGAVIAVPGDYKANLLLEAKRGSTWTPVYTLYDSLSTDPACVGCVKTNVGAGFYTDVNQPPSADFSWPAPVVERQEVTLTSTSADPEGRAITEEWDLDNDGAFDDATGPTASLTFATPGTYLVGLRATDDRGLTAHALKEIVVQDCSQGEVSSALRKDVYPVLAPYAENTAYYVACDVVAAQGL